MSSGCCNCSPTDNTWYGWITCSYKFNTLLAAGAALVAGATTIFTLYPEQTKKVIFYNSAILGAAIVLNYVYEALPKFTYSQEKDVTIDVGLNFIKLQDGEDLVKASLCKLSKSITIINNFDPDQDNLRLFCSKKIDLSSDNLSIDHYWGMTVLTIQGNEDISKIYFLGDVNIKPEDVLFGKT